MRCKAEGPAGRLDQALDDGRDAAAAAFRLRDGKPLWGSVANDGVEEDDQGAAALAAVLRLPQEAGLAERPEDYPWIGGSAFPSEEGREAQ